MDWKAFEVWAVLEGAKAANQGLASITVERRLRRLKRLTQDLGYDLEDNLLEEGRRALAQAAKGEHSPNTHRNWVKALNTLARYQGLDSPFEYRESPPPTKHRALTEDEVARLIRVRWDDPYRNKLARAVVHLSLYLGIRRSEFAALEVPDVRGPLGDDRFGVIEIREPAKGGRARKLPLESQAWSPKRPFGAYMSHKLVANDDERALWVRPPGPGDDGPQRCTPTYLYEILREAGNRAGVHYNFNVSRHTALTRLYRETDAKTKHVQAHAGHRSEESSDTYVRVSHADLEDVLARTPRSDPYAKSRSEE